MDTPQESHDAAAPVAPGALSMNSADLVVISAGKVTAQISPLAASLRSLSAAGRHLSEPWLEAGPAPSGSGLTLAPFPNRVAGGAWELDGLTVQLDITEPGPDNAIHGLLRNTGYQVTAQSAASVTLAARIWPQHGYPFQVLHTVSYTVSADAERALTVRQELLNEGDAAAPVALGAHPYLRAGDADPADLTVTVPAGEVIRMDERMIPTRTEAVGGADDLRQGGRVADLDIDQAYTSLQRDADGLARMRLTDASGRGSYLWVDETCQFTHIFVTTKFTGRAKAVAAEPMSAPADTFNSGTGLRWISPGESFGINWGIGAVEP